VQTVYSNLDSTYPHIVVFARGLVGKRAYYIGKSHIIVIDGTRDWIGYVPVIVLVRLNEALDLYQQMGVDRDRIEKCRRALLVMCGGSFYDLFFNPTSCGREFFSVKSFLKTYGCRAEFLKGFIHRFIASSINEGPNKNPLSSIRLAMRRLFFRDEAALNR
jgi:hypothetical protein